jgi:hypothetical protein
MSNSTVEALLLPDGRLVALASHLPSGACRLVRDMTGTSRAKWPFMDPSVLALLLVH